MFRQGKIRGKGGNNGSTKGRRIRGGLPEKIVRQTKEFGEAKYPKVRGIIKKSQSKGPFQRLKRHIAKILTRGGQKGGKGANCQKKKGRIRHAAFLLCPVRMGRKGGGKQ